MPTIDQRAALYVWCTGKGMPGDIAARLARNATKFSKTWELKKLSYIIDSSMVWA